MNGVGGVNGLNAIRRNDSNEIPLQFVYEVGWRFQIVSILGGFTAVSVNDVDTGCRVPALLHG